MALEQQLNWCQGSGILLIKLLNTALNLLNEVLVLRKKISGCYDKEEDKDKLGSIRDVKSPLDLALTHHATDKTHPILTITHLLYHQYNVHLPEIAILLLTKLSQVINKS